MAETLLFAIFFVIIIVAFVLLVLIAVANDITYMFTKLLGQFTTNSSAPGYSTANMVISLTNTFFIIIFITFVAIIAIVIMYRRRV